MFDSPFLQAASSATPSATPNMNGATTVSRAISQSFTFVTPFEISAGESNSEADVRHVCLQHNSRPYITARMSKGAKIRARKYMSTLFAIAPRLISLPFLLTFLPSWKHADEALCNRESLRVRD